MIVGTAGHIDHGKTTLVKALTGVDTDRLPEEKQRGISIELGYAYLDVPGHDERIGFIDVPGHERLVHTMLAGASGIDLALLLVAADDGVMPQTREHLAVLSLLGLARGAAVLTKIDRADAARVDAVRDEVTALLAPTSLAGAPVFAVSATSGAGIDALRAWLFEQARGCTVPLRDDAAFRLAIDRAFTLDGVGTVVAGTVHAGRVRVGDELAIVPAATPMRARVRSLHAQNRAVAQAQAGQRCAVALANVSKDRIQRGQWLVPESAAVATDRVDTWLRLWHDEARPLRSGMHVHVHLGACDVEGTVAVLDDGDALAAGERKRVQLVLRHPIGAWRGDRVVLRDASAARTIAGGIVLDPFAPARYRRTPQRLADLHAWGLADAESGLSALLGSSVHGVDLGRWQRARGLADGSALRLPAGALRAAAGDADWALDALQVEAIAERVVAVLRDYHARHDEELGPDAGRLRRLVAPRLAEPLWRALMARWLAERRVAQRGAFVHLPEHGIKLSATEERIAQKVATMLHAAGFEGAWVRDLARDSRESEALMRTTLARLAQRGELHQVVKDLFYPQATITQLAALARTVGAGHDGAVTAARFRDATQLGRKRAIQVLEYFDRVGLLRRVNDVHRLRSDTDLFKEPA